jgi:exodeoxyribonuclease VII large subunit
MRALATRLTRAFTHRQALEARRLAAVRARLIREVQRPLPQASRLVHAARTLTRARDDRLEHAARALHRLRDALALLNPGAVLERGYAIVSGPDGAIVADARQLAIGASVALKFAQGGAGATVTSTTLDDD